MQAGRSVDPLLAKIRDKARLRIRHRRCPGLWDQPCLLLEESDCLLNEGGMVLKDAAVPCIREMLNCAFGSLRARSNELNDGTITSSSPFTTRTGC